MNNQKDSFEALDIITLISFLAQIHNINEDAEEKTYIHNIIKVIAEEIQKLHEENDRLELKINKILKMLERKEEVNL